MKLSFFLCLLSILQVSAMNTSAQKITMDKNNVSLAAALKEIHKQSGLSVLYNTKMLKRSAPVTLHLQNANLDDALKQCFQDQPLSYIINNATIVITPKEELKKPVIVINITGVVKDSKGMPMAGVSVRVKGTDLGTQTNTDGSYSIKANSNSDVLVFSFIGFINQEVSVNNQTKIDVTLVEQETKLDEIIVVGYGTQKKADITGSTTRADLNTMKNAPSTSILQDLQGTVPGLNIGQVTTAGSDPSITIRGQNTISGTTTPLIVVDGFIYRGSLTDINPSDVASFDILKDASAAAVYGSQASNGVILITTKTGNKSALNKPQVDFSSSLSIQQMTNKDMLPGDRADFLRKIGDRFISESRIGPDLTQLNPNFNPTSHFQYPTLLPGYQNGVNTNWWDLLTNKSPVIQDYTVGVSGKTSLSNYYLSFGYTDQDNLIKNDTYKRFVIRANVDTKITDWMRIGMQTNYSINNYSGASPSISSLIMLPPLVAYKDEQGNLIQQPVPLSTNPLLSVQAQDLDKRYNLIGNFFADINIPGVKGLNYRANFGNNLTQNQHFNFDATGQSFTGSAYKDYNSQYNLTFDNILSYKRSFGRNDLDVTVLYGLEKDRYDQTNTNAAGFSDFTLGYNRLDLGTPSLLSVTPDAWQETSVYQMARVNYAFDQKYLFTATVRRDGFSGFSAADKYATFPSIAAAWRINQEDFLKSVSAINDLKLRLSYGSTGNRTVGRYQTLSRTTFSLGAAGYLYGDGTAPQPGQYITSLANSNLKWETTNSLNAGTDFSLFKSRLYGTFDAYFSKTHDLLYNLSLPQITGFSSIPVNIGKVGNIGQELSITGIPFKSTNFKWTVTGNFSINHNKVISIFGKGANGVEPDLIDGSNPTNSVFIGKSYGVVYDYKVAGMWQVADYNAGRIPAGFTYGEYKIQDTNGDSQITPVDKQILGYLDPLYRFSFNNSFQYKKFTFSFFVNSIQGGSNYYVGLPAQHIPNPDNVYNNNLFNFNYWTPNNPNAKFRQLGAYPTVLGDSFSPVESRNFIRLQDVSLSYSLPESILRKLKIRALSIYVDAHNLLTITKWDGWDPEVSNQQDPYGAGLDPDGYPVMKNFTFGVNISL